MDTTMERADIGTAREARLLAGGSSVEFIAGAGAVVLPILGLLGVLPVPFAAISFIAIGAGMMMQGSAMAELGGGLGAELLGGAAVCALGILGLLKLAPMTLLPVAAIVAGAALLLAGRRTSRLASHGARLGDETTGEILRESVRTAADTNMLAGLAAAVLGILVLAGVGTLAAHLSLVLAAALVLGAGMLLNGTHVGARMAALLRRADVLRH